MGSSLVPVGSGGASSPISGLEWAHPLSFNLAMSCSSTNSHTSQAEFGKQNLPAKKPALHPEVHEQPGALSLAGMGGQPWLTGAAGGGWDGFSGEQ